MMRQYELVERVLAYNPNADEALLNKAYVYAMQKHGGQKRASGDPYIAHPLEVAAILTEMKLDDATIVVALLHDTIEDTDATRAEIDQLFGDEIGAIVEGLTKIERLNLMSRKEAQAENLRKLLLAISQDVRVLLVKLADRLHNMRTLEHMPDHKKARIAQETMDIYAPLAGRMGMQDMRSELDDIAFKILLPDHYATLKKRLAATEKKNAETVKIIGEELRQRFESEGIEAEVYGRLKSPWSIYSKIQRRSVAMEQLSDIIGFRVIVKSIEDCYRTLGVVHTSWKVVPGRFKDYISVPKYNDYRSLHTTIVGPSRQRVELQIRTDNMHRIAELGIAAHALYKDDVALNPIRLEKESRAYSWLRSTITHLTSGSSTDEFLEDTKLELFQDQVFCFTPRGKLISLPRGATPIDLAYALHTGLGDTCVGAKVNGAVAPLITQLRSGDEVEILTDEHHVPPANWENIATTGKARAAIRRAVRTAQQERAFVLGKQVAHAAIEAEHLVLDENDLEALAPKLEMTSLREMYIAVGDGSIAPADLTDAAATLKGIHRTKRKMDLPVADQADGWFSLRGRDDFKFRVPGGQNLLPSGEAVLEKLNFNTPVAIGSEGVVPGDRLIGILALDGTLTIYPVHSDALAELDNSNVVWIDVRWSLETISQHYYKVGISVLSVNKPGELALISTGIAQSDSNIHNLVMQMASPDFHKLVLEIEVRDLPQLSDVIANLRQSEGLSEVRRATYVEASALAEIEWSAKDKVPSVMSTDGEKEQKEAEINR